MKYYNIQFLASNADNINNACVKDNGNSQIIMKLDQAWVSCSQYSITLQNSFESVTHYVHVTSDISGSENHGKHVIFS